MLKALKLSFLLGAQLTLAHPSSTTAEKLIKCLDDYKVPQAYPNTTEFDLSAKPYNVRLTYIPKAIAVPRTVIHVRNAVTCGRKLGVKVNPRSGGYSEASHGIGGEDGHLVIDMKLLNDVKVDVKTGLATVGSGARLGNMAIALDAQGKRALPHGVCPKVGVGGHVIHGGVGYSTHNHGLFLDHLVEAEIVLADSSVVRASKTKNPDLFWALRGAGYSYGIVTKFTFRTIAQPDEVQLFYFPFVWDIPQSVAGWKVFQDYAASTFRPKEMNFRVVITDAAVYGYSGTAFLFEGAFHGSRADYDKFIEPFLTGIKALGGYFPPEFSGIAEVTTTSYLNALTYANNNELLGLRFGVPGTYEQLASTLDEQLQGNSYLKSMFTNKLTNATIETLMTDIANPYPYDGTQAWMFIVLALGGPNSALTKTPSSSTSFAHREKLLLWEISNALKSLTDPYPASGVPFVANFVKKVKDSEKATRGGDRNIGAYYNYVDPELGDHKQAGVEYWGKEGYERLSLIKGRYDPAGVFQNPQTVKGRTYRGSESRP